MNYFSWNYLAELTLGQFVSRCYRHPLEKSARERRIRKSMTQIFSTKELMKIPGFVSLSRPVCAREMNPVGHGSFVAQSSIFDPQAFLWVKLTCPPRIS